MDPVARILVLRASHPLRPVGWRWEAARMIRNQSSVSNVRYPDPYTEDAALLQDMLNSSASPDDIANALFASGPQGDAYAFWSATWSGENDGGGPLTSVALMRAELEALILANKRPAYISKVIGISEDAVRWYERWWWDVRDRLKRPIWVAAHAIGDIHVGTPAVVLPNLIRAYGYYTKSARIVRAVTSTFDRPAALFAAKDPSKFFSNDAVLSGSLKAALSTRLLPLNGNTYARVIELHHEALEAASKADAEVDDEIRIRYKEAISQLSNKIEHGYAKAPDDPNMVNSTDIVIHEN